MTRWIVTTLLGLAFALSVSLSAAQAAAMSVDMSLGMAGSHDCQGCAGGTNPDGAESAVCVQFCVPALAAVLPLEPVLVKVQGVTLVAVGQRLDRGVTAAPIPAPPKI